ncbi:hypothetical protein JXA40_04125 [bacterium]|nr:hypothetical protein [candidate division CSSED10-310 bacterium]
MRPLPLHIATHLPAFTHPDGNPVPGDPFMFCWNLWWVKGWISARHDLLFTRHLFHPFGIGLVYHTLSPLNGVLAAPFWNDLGPVASHNLLLMFHSLLTAVGTFFLARVVGAGRMESFLAGEIAVMWPARISHVPVHLNIAGTGWIPLALLALILALRRSGPGILAAASISIAAVALTDWHHLVSLLCITWVTLVDSDGKNLKRNLAILGTAWLIAVACLSPIILGMLRNPCGIAVRSLKEKSGFSVAPESLITPPPGYLLSRAAGLPAGPVYPESAIETTGYLGVVPLALLIGGLIAGGRRSRLFMLAAVLLMLFALGPEIRIGRTGIPLPGRLIHVLPGLEFSRTPGRFMVTAGICLAVGAAVMISRTRFRPGWRNGLVPILGGLCLVDLLPPPLPLVEAVIPGIYRNLPVTSADRPAVLDIPCSWTIREYQYFQTRHTRPISTGFVSRIPERVFQRMDELPLFKDLADPDRAADILASADPGKLCDLASILRAGMVVVHRNLMSDPAGFNARDLAARWNAEIWRDDGNRLILVLNDTAPRKDSPPRAYFIRNWAPAETWERIAFPVRWALGKEASAVLFVPENTRVLNLSFQIFPAPQRDGDAQAMTLRFNGREAMKVTLLPENRWSGYACELTGPFDPEGNRLDFEFRSATPPRKLRGSVSEDTRPLSAAVAGIRLEAG